jgi:tetratricopeptide (TPR) repeat protein
MKSVRDLTIWRNRSWGAPPLWLALCLLPALVHAMPSNPEAAARAKYTCPDVKSDADRKREADALSTRTSDKNALACAADLRFALTTASPTNLALRLEALDSLARYIDLVLSLKHFDLVRANWDEQRVRLEHAEELANTLVPATRKSWPNDPAAIILTARIESALAGPDDVKVTVKDVAELKRAVALDPTARHGEGLMLLGRAYMDLPPLFGGSTEQAVAYLEQARKIAPDNPRTLRYLAEAYDELGKRDAAEASLRALAAVTPSNTDLQMYADEWRMGEGLAARMGNSGLADKFAGLRAGLMKDHPDLLLRKVAQVFGHGGDDPMTGSSQYTGERTNAH